MSDLFASLDLFLSSTEDNGCVCFDTNLSATTESQGCEILSKQASISTQELDGVLADFERRSGVGASWFCTIA
uniref:Pheromone Phb3.1 B43 n=1 Tax=Coprinopsis cinerea TaxID=5346 RepID=Q6TMB7_COPCI|nr:pheromone precursor Phb3.1 B43 [Coprinopsis cinerea]